jgi:CRISPR-associated protein Cas5t
MRGCAEEDHVIGVRVTVPLACWRKGAAREFLETEELPPPATAYGMLLSLVGEEDRFRHRGCRVTTGLFEKEGISTVVRTTWRIKDMKLPQGVGENAKPDFQQLVIHSDLLVLCDSSEEQARPTLESRVVRALREPSSVVRFGGLSLGESTHLVNDLWLIDNGATLHATAQVFLTSKIGDVTLPVWVDHVGSARTRYGVGSLEPLSQLPAADRLPRIDNVPT